MSLPNEKITHDLSSQLRGERKETKVQVIIELNNKANQYHPAGHSRQEKMANLKEAFSQGVKPVEQVISQQGGHVLDYAWLNQTLRAEVPINCLNQLAELDEVQVIDLPRTLTPDFK